MSFYLSCGLALLTTSFGPANVVPAYLGPTSVGPASVNPASILVRCSGGI